VTGKVVRVKVDAGLKAAEEKAEEAMVASPQPGHVIDVKLDVPHARMEDFLRLVSKTGTAAITGVVETKAALHIAPGDDPVNRRMKLDGNFKLDDGVFTSDKVQARVEELSFRAQGRPDDLKHADAKGVKWAMQGDFHVANGVIALPNLEYTVPGADVQLQGSYGLDGEVRMDGTARMQATVSEMGGDGRGFCCNRRIGYSRRMGQGRWCRFGCGGHGRRRISALISGGWGMGRIRKGLGAAGLAGLAELVLSESASQRGVRGLPS
jgi:hypothetical protein